MRLSHYQVGQKPLRPLAIDVFDSVGNRMDLSFYTEFNVRLLDPDNKPVDLADGVLQSAGAREGKFNFVWPRSKSLFHEPGDYLLQLELVGEGARDYTSPHTIRVRELGGNN